MDWTWYVAYETQRILSDAEMKALRRGDLDTFAELVLELYPEACEEAGFSYRDRYGAVEADEYEEGHFTMWTSGNPYVEKFFFQADDGHLVYRGSKC